MNRRKAVARGIIAGLLGALYVAMGLDMGWLQATLLFVASGAIIGLLFWAIVQLVED